MNVLHLLPSIASIRYSQAEVFEEIATMDFPFEGIPTVPPRKNMTHMAFFCSGCRYRVTAAPSDTVLKVSESLDQANDKWSHSEAAEVSQSEASETTQSVKLISYRLMYKTFRQAESASLMTLMTVTDCPSLIQMKVKEALISGGIARSNKPDGVRSTPGIKTQEDLVSCPSDNILHPTMCCPNARRTFSLLQVANREYRTIPDDD
jgi:hypothetical protein